MTQHVEAARAGRFGHRTFWVSTSILLTLFIVSIYVVLPRNVLSSTVMESIKPVVNTVWPQGWGFFTKDPDSPTMDAYEPGSEGASLLVTPQMRAENLFGLSRSARAQGPEMAILNSLLEKADWMECEREWEKCMSEAWQQPAKSLHNASPVPTVCGDVVLTMEKATPWAYRNLVPEPYRMLQAAHVSVTCPHGGNK